MNIEKIKSAVENSRINWQKHALERMMERNISRSIVKKVLTFGTIIEEYAEDKPYPSSLVLGWVGDKPCHVVVAYNIVNKFCFIVTAYRPDSRHFESDCKTRKQL